MTEARRGSRRDAPQTQGVQSSAPLRYASRVCETASSSVSCGRPSLSSPAGTAPGPVLPAQSVKMAVIVVATLPMLLVYPFIQRYFVKGALIGSVKG